MAEKKIYTLQEVEAFADFIGMGLFQWQKELIVRYLNGEREVFFIPQRACGYSSLRAKADVLVALFLDYQNQQN
jgi:hypothetical protein